MPTPRSRLRPGMLPPELGVTSYLVTKLQIKFNTTGQP